MKKSTILLAKARSTYKDRPLSQEEIRARYPRLIRALKYVLLGTDTEAANVIYCYRLGIGYGGEACSHSGLTTADRLIHASSQSVRYRMLVESL